MANVLFSSLANLRAPRKWAAWFPNRPTITCAQCWIPRVQETHHDSCTELQSYQTYPYRDNREHSRGHPTRSSGYYSLAHTQPVKSSPCASYQKGAYGPARRVHGAHAHSRSVVGSVSSFPASFPLLAISIVAFSFSPFYGMLVQA